MEEYLLKKTFNTPEVHFIPSEGYLKIEGRSIPEDPNEFYDSIIKLLKEYYKNPEEITRCDIKLEYINSGSSKFMLELLRILKINYDQGKDCIVNWYYEEDDESIQELGMHYKSTIKLPMKLIEYY
ncbi:MAG: DUF1987 domain-containing protein [Bacteroidales bacterium]|nr:DUF1987 domain-containing protein [Bacteroidales bacterium]MCF8390574.1 DUF1987 domain-containing protein [Bacteroidales bacterium]